MISFRSFIVLGLYLTLWFFFCTQTCKFPKPLVENTNPLSTAFPLHLYQESVLSPLVPFLEVSGRIQIELILFLPYMFGGIHHEAIWAWSFLYEFVFTNSIPLIGLFILSVSFWVSFGSLYHLWTFKLSNCLQKLIHGILPLFFKICRICSDILLLVISVFSFF